MFSSKPYSAVTVAVERLTSESYEEDDLSGIPDLVEVIKLQATGPTEAARAIRKKLKYGNVHRQLRALVILDGLIQNAGPRFQRAFADEPLLERLRVCGTSELSDPDVRKKCSVLFRSWATEYKNTPGLERIARLYNELPKRKQVVTQERSRVIRETDNPFGDEDDEPPNSPEPPTQASSSRSPPPPAQNKPVPAPVNSFSHVSSSKDKKKKDKDKRKSKHRKFDLAAEKESMKTAIAESSIAATNLMNALQSINREKERISENPAAVAYFESCKQLRRKILRYIHHVESEQWLGSLLHANDELVQALMTFEQLDRSIDADSDSDDELAEQAHMYRMMSERSKSPTSQTSPTSAMAELHIDEPTPQPPQPPRAVPPPRPSAVSKPSAQLTVPGRPADDYADASDEDEDEDDNDPFADRNAVSTPNAERSEPAW
ncbi:hypothetical protein SLS53_001537 [Cytospora paraplurivora]|uniref:VHS domain-containing protein n=1 Tax=Cytospora paraplurivora TaxID=2898453 RepID=A0AAN9UNF6_9PEZI